MPYPSSNKGREKPSEIGFGGFLVQAGELNRTSNAQWAWDTIHYTCSRHLSMLAPPIWLHLWLWSMTLVISACVCQLCKCSAYVESRFLNAVFTLVFQPFPLHLTCFIAYAMHCGVAGRFYRLQPCGGCTSEKSHFLYDLSHFSVQNFPVALLFFM